MVLSDEHGSIVMDGALVASGFRNAGPEPYAAILCVKFGGAMKWTWPPCSMM